MSPAERRRDDLARERATQARRDASALRCVRLGAGKTLREVHDALVLGCTLTTGTPVDVTRRTLRGLVESGVIVERDGVFCPVSAERGRREPAPTPSPPPPEALVAVHPPQRTTVTASDLEAWVEAHPGATYRAAAVALGCSDTHLTSLVRQRGARVREDRHGATARTAPWHLYPSPPSPKSPPGEAATASGGDSGSAEVESLRARLELSTALDEIAVALGAAVLTVTDQLPRIAREVVEERDALRHRVQQLERDMAGLADIGLQRNALEARVAELSSALAKERGQSREAYAVEVATLTVLVEQALSVAGLPASSDDPLLFRLGILIERLRRAQGAP